MNLLNLFRGRQEQRAAGDDPSWAAMLGLQDTRSGQHVDANSAEGLSAVFACVQALSESTSCLPLHTYARGEDGERNRVEDHWLARLLREPNEDQTGVEFRESMTASVLLNGNAYARKEFNGAGEIVALHPLVTRGVSIVKLASGRHAFDYSDAEGKRVRLLPEEIFHLRDRCDPGSIVGRSRISIARETLGMSLAQRTHGASTFRNGARPAGVIEWDKDVGFNQEHMAGAREMLRQYEGAVNAGKTIILTNGLKFKPVSMNLEDAQWIAAMQFSTEEVARIFRVPPTMIADLRHGNYSNTVELGSQFVRYSLQRWITMWEQGISRSLLGPIARRRYYSEHSVEGLLRGAPEARADFYAKAIASGWMDAEEVRRLENLPKREIAPK